MEHLSFVAAAIVENIACCVLLVKYDSNHFNRGPHTVFYSAWLNFKVNGKVATFQKTFRVKN